MSRQAVMSLRNVHKTYVSGQNKVRALVGIDLSIEQGEFVAVMGPSGSGKSTLLNVLGILDTLTEGAYELAGVAIRNLTERRAALYRNRYLGFVFQSFNLIPFKTALDNVALPLSYQRVSRSERYRRARECLTLMNLADRMHHYPSELSGGQNQRVAIARALVTNPKVILADEPTGNLDSHTSDEVIGILERVHQSGRTIVMVTHDDATAERTDRTIRLRDGAIVNGCERN